MKNSIRRMIEDLKNIFTYSSGYIKRDSLTIKEHIQTSLAETNCKRIFAASPILLLMDLYGMFIICTKRGTDEFYSSMSEMIYISPYMLMIIAGILFAVILAYAGMVAYQFYIRKSRSQDARRCRMCYRSFWAIWGVGMFFVSLGHALMDRDWVFYVAVLLVVCLVPLCTTADIIYSVTGVCLLSGTVIFLAESVNQKFNIIVTTTIAMLILGYIAQIFEVEMWTLREYIYVTTFMDALTQLLNRRGGNALMELELEKREGETELGVIMLDIDYFKQYNDSLGHDEGDNCLHKVACGIREAVGERTQLMIRHGGEEFVVVLFDTTPEETMQWAEHIRKSIYDMAIAAPYREVAEVVTVSVGATVVKTAQKLMYENILKTADQALYRAKQTGRNRVVFQ